MTGGGKGTGDEKPFLHDYDMHINATPNMVDTTDLITPGDVPNREIREILFMHKEVPDPIMDETTDHTYFPLMWHELETSRGYFLSTEDIQTLRVWHDFAIAKRAFWLAMSGLASVIVMFVEQELAFDFETRRYRTMQPLPSALKGVITVITVIMLCQLWDLYDYMAVGHKKEWYTGLFTNSPEGGKDLPRGILGTAALRNNFIVEICLLAFHIPPGLDFRYWCCREDAGNEGLLKPFISDKWNMLLFFRLYLFVRVLRDAAMIYRRRFQIYEGGYRRRGGHTITYAAAMRYYYVINKPRFVVLLVLVNTLILTYMQYVSERDWQPEVFDVKNTLWFILFAQLLCGYNGMFPMSTFGQTVMLATLINGLVVLSLTVEVIFGAMALNGVESWAVDFLQEYEVKEKERDAATSYLAYWWRYAALVGEDEKSSGMSEEELQDKKTMLYTKAVSYYNQLRSESSKLNSLESCAEDSTAQDLSSAEMNLDAIVDALPPNLEATNEDLNKRMDSMDETNKVILAQLDMLLSA